MQKYNSILIVGPTASGKSDVAILLAKKLKGEIINTDSMQIYAEMQIGTARPTVEEQDKITHHLFGFIPVDSEYSVSEYRADAEKVFKEIIDRKKIPIFVGGTGLYAQSLISNFSYGENTKDEKLRAKYEKLAAEKGKEEVYKKLKKLDPEAAEKISCNDLKRIIRAIEIYTLSKKKKSEMVEENKAMQTNMQTSIKPLIIGINYPREQLYERINLRTENMINNGLLDEAQIIFNKNLPEKSQSLGAIAYKELFPYFRKERSLAGCIELLKQKTRNYAKRQITWFKKMNVIWFDKSEYKKNYKIVKKIKKIYKAK